MRLVRKLERIYVPIYYMLYTITRIHVYYIHRTRARARLFTLTMTALLCRDRQDTSKHTYTESTLKYDIIYIICVYVYIIRGAMSYYVHVYVILYMVRTR